MRRNRYGGLSKGAFARPLSFKTNRMETINKSIEILTSGGPWLFVLPYMAFAFVFGVVGEFVLDKILGL